MAHRRREDDRPDPVMTTGEIGLQSTSGTYSRTRNLPGGPMYCQTRRGLCITGAVEGGIVVTLAAAKWAQASDGTAPK